MTQRVQSPFVVFMLGRAGSSLLTSLLNSHDQISCRDEFFAAMTETGIDPHTQLLKVMQYLAYDDDASIKGFKTKPPDIPAPHHFATLVQVLNAKAIFLRRTNLVRHTVSWLLSLELHAAHGVWNVTDESQRIRTLDVSVEEFDRHLQTLHHGNRELIDLRRQLGVESIIVDYEELHRDRQGTMTQILTFLGASDAPMTSTLVKNTPNRLEDVLVHHDQIRAYYVGTPHADMFDD